jgi:hypothetical protein
MARLSKNLPEEDNRDTPEDIPAAGVGIISEAIKEKGKEWVESFPNVTGMSVKKKNADESNEGEMALVFKVPNKKTDLEYGKIPEFISYVARDGKKYNILTDVVEEDIPEGSSIAFPDQPLPLGNSISRKNEATGSIGLLVQKNDGPGIDFIVSCYHVFCATELRKGNKTFVNSGNDVELLSPSVKDDGTDIVAEVVEGCMDSQNDFSVARVINNAKIDNGKRTLKTIPKSFDIVFSEDVGDIVTLCGRTSEISQGRIKSHAASQTIFYFQKTKRQFYTGLIEVTPFSEGGDSGGVVINKKKKVIGLVIGGNGQSSYVLPVGDYLLNRDYSLKIN